MDTKIIEVRDRMTMFAVLCVDMNPGRQYPENGSFSEDQFKGFLDAFNARLYHMRRVGFPCDGRPNIGMTHLRADDRFTNDYFAWTDRTYANAHKYITEHWTELKDGDVVDVEYILGEKPAPAIAVRLEQSST